MKIIRSLGWLCLIIGVLLGGPAGAQSLSDKRVALVIGNGAYTSDQITALPNPANDARAVATKLRNLGIEVIEVIDADFRGMRRALSRFSAALEDAEAGMFFYAGHGMEYRGDNYLFPIDAELVTEGDIISSLIEVRDFLRVMEIAVPVRLLILDACRDNPMARSLQRRLGGARSGAIGRGLARINAREGEGTLIAYATSPGEVAADGEGHNSPFTIALLEHLDEPGLEVEAMMKRVRSSVFEDTDRQQLPWTNSSLLGPFVLNLNLEIEVEPSPKLQIPDSGLQAEIVFWESIKDSDQPAAFEAYLARFGEDGVFAPLAKLRMKASKSEKPVEVPALVQVEPVTPERLASEKGETVVATLSSEPNILEPEDFDPSEIESVLGLNHEGWRRVQIALNTLGFDPRGIDGRPGANTRGAIGAWQEHQGLSKTGFLDQEMHVRLLAEAEPKLAVLEAAKPKAFLPKVVQPSVGTFPKYSVGQSFRDCETCPEMVVVPAGEFIMGSPRGEKGWNREGPQHRVKIAEPFAVGKFEVTRSEYRKFVEATDHNSGDTCRTVEGGYIQSNLIRNWFSPAIEQSGNHPAVCINHEDAQAYVDWLSSITDRSYRLLSEAEWEYSARSGAATRRYWGDDLDEAEACRYSNGMDTSVEKINARFFRNRALLACDDGYAKTSPIGTFRANNFGLHDMIGNAWEWVADRYHSTYENAPNDGSVRLGLSPQFVIRGGSWRSPIDNLRSAFRININADIRSNDLGFRVASALR